jgi:hypothetical protein
MKRMRWSEIRRRLGARRAGQPPSTTDAFWSDFRARARLHPQVAPAPRRARWGWPGIAAVSTAAAAAIGLILLLPARGGREWTGAVRSLRVIAPHEAVIIMDEPDETFVWIVEEESEAAHAM